MPKIFIALSVQLLVLVVLTCLVYLAPVLVSPPYPYWLLLLIQAVVAAVISPYFGLPSWWRWIQFLLPIGLYGAILVQFESMWALIIFVLIWLLFANAFSEQVPLYLTNRATRKALTKLLKPRQQIRFIDLGCGLGGNVTFMAQQQGVVESHGVETSPLPYLVSKLSSWLRGGQVFAMDIWKTELAYYDVVYAFLSPEPMPKLWQKVKNEMRAGSVFVSNSFAVPGVEPTEVWQLNDKRGSILYIYYL